MGRGRGRTAGKWRRIEKNDGQPWVENKEKEARGRIAAEEHPDRSIPREEEARGKEGGRAEELSLSSSSFPPTLSPLFIQSRPSLLREGSSDRRATLEEEARESGLRGRGATTFDFPPFSSMSSLPSSPSEHRSISPTSLASSSSKAPTREKEEGEDVTADLFLSSWKVYRASLIRFLNESGSWTRSVLRRETESVRERDRKAGLYLYK